MGAAGAGSLAQVVNTAIENRHRFEAMRSFFDGVGEGHASGIWEDVPEDKPQFRQRQLRQLEKIRAKNAQTQDID